MENPVFNKLFEVLSESDSENKWLDIIKNSELDSIDIVDDVSGWSLLHYASENIFSEVTKWLIHNGADVNLEDKIGRTPYLIALDAAIDEAVQYGHDKIDFSVVEGLILNGAKESHVAKDGLSKEKLLSLYGDNARHEYELFKEKMESGLNL